MRRRFLGTSAGGLVLAAGALAGLARSARAQDRPNHRIILHVGGSDPVLMGTALNNIDNAHETYAARGQTVAIELVANGQGYAMLRADISPVRARLTQVHAMFPAVVFSACQLSRRGAAAAEHKTIDQIPQVPEATDTPAGIARITELQEQGWTYIRV